LQAEELNTIVGNAFRMAYVAQLQRQPILQDVISPRSTPSCRKDKQEHRSSLVRFSFLLRTRDRDVRGAIIRRNFGETEQQR